MALRTRSYSVPSERLRTPQTLPVAPVPARVPCNSERSTSSSSDEPLRKSPRLALPEPTLSRSASRESLNCAESASGKVCPQCSEVDAFDSDGRTCTKCGVVQEWPLQPELRDAGAAEACCNTLLLHSASCALLDGQVPSRMGRATPAPASSGKARLRSPASITPSRARYVALQPIAIAPSHR